MVGWWTRNYWWISFPVLIGAIAGAWISPSLTANMFCTPEEACVREWFSATGGLLAVAAAGITIGYLSRQISMADKQHRQTVAIQLDRRISISKAIISICAGVEAQIVNWESSPTGNSNKDEIIFHSDQIVRLYNQPIFKELEAEFYYSTERSLKSIIEIVKTVAERARRSPGQAIFLQDVFTGIRTYNRDATAACDDFIRRYRDLVGDA